VAKGKHAGSVSLSVTKLQKLSYLLFADMSTGEDAEIADEKSIK